MTRILRITLSLLLLGVVAIVAIGCDDVLEDSTFRLWCGDNLCAWTTEEGAIRRAPTWHKNDFGVELVATPTTISQTSNKGGSCLLFTTVADVDPGAQVSVGIDFNLDGSIDYEQPIASVGFREVKSQVTAPLAYRGLRVVIMKKGIGRAVLAELRLQSKDDRECTAPPVQLEGLGLGAACTAGDGAEECRTRICCNGLCSECCESTLGGAPPVACAHGGACRTRIGPDTFRQTDSGAIDPFDVFSHAGYLAAQCNPGDMHRASGADCLVNDDCMSGVCDPDPLLYDAGTRTTYRSADAGPDGQPFDADARPTDAVPCPVPYVKGAGDCYQPVASGRCR